MNKQKLETIKKYLSSYTCARSVLYNANEDTNLEEELGICEINKIDIVNLLERLSKKEVSVNEIYKMDTIGELGLLFDKYEINYYLD